MGKVHGNTKHGMRHSRLYNIWCNMKARCTNPSHTAFANYGGRGITVCSEWIDFKGFQSWAMSNGYTDLLTIDREDTNEGYFPNNCRWVDMKTQENNRSNNRLVNYNGKVMSVAEWADTVGVPYKTLYTRLFQNHWSVERALRKE